mgnify:CR=1 FL=1
MNEGPRSAFNQPVPTLRASIVPLAGLLAASLSLTACDDDVADPTFEPTSVPESKPIDELDEEEEQDFCEEASAWAEDVVGNQLPTILCNSEAIGLSVGADGSIDLAACKEARDSCLAEPSDIDIEGGDNLQCDFSEVESCGATVGEFSACFEEAAQLLDRAASAITCERAASGDLPNETDFAISANCEALFERCGSDEVDDNELPPPE